MLPIIHWDVVVPVAFPSKFIRGLGYFCSASCWFAPIQKFYHLPCCWWQHQKSDSFLRFPVSIYWFFRIFIQLFFQAFMFSLNNFCNWGTLTSTSYISRSFNNHAEVEFDCFSDLPLFLELYARSLRWCCFATYLVPFLDRLFFGYRDFRQWSLWSHCRTWLIKELHRKVPSSCSPR